jgi:chromosome segregation ATPase
MELLLVFLSTAIGTVVGVAAAIFMMQRKNRSNVGSDSILRTQLQNTEWALASAGKDVEDLRKQLEERLAESQAARTELDGAQQRLAAATAESEKDAAKRAEFEGLAERLRELESAAPAAEEAHLQQVSDLTRQIDGERERAGSLAAELDQLREAATEADSRSAALEAALAAERDKYEILTAECVLEKDRGAQLSVEGSAERERTAALAAECAVERERVAELSAELARLREAGEQSAQDRTVLEGQLLAERDRAGALAVEVEAIRTAHASLVSTLQQERESAAEGMQLLLQAQNKLSGASPAPPAAVATNGYANGTAA